MEAEKDEFLNRTSMTLKLGPVQEQCYEKSEKFIFPRIPKFLKVSFHLRPKLCGPEIYSVTLRTFCCFVDTVNFTMSSIEIGNGHKEFLILTSCAGSRAICPRPTRPIYAALCGPPPVHSPHALRLRRLTRLASNSCGRHEY